MIGRTLQVLYEDIDYERGMFVGRSEFDAPEIDTKVYFSVEKNGNGKKSACNQHFIGNRIEKFAEIGHQILFTCNMSV